MAETTTPLVKSKKIYDVYIIYTSVDKNFVYEVMLPKLEGRKLRVFIDDRDLLPGDKWEEKLFSAMNASRNCLIVLTRNYYSRITEAKADEYVWKVVELRKALELSSQSGLKIIPVLVDPTNIPEQLRPFQRVDLYNEDVAPSSWGKLLKSLSSKRKAVDEPKGVTNINIYGDVKSADIFKNASDNAESTGEGTLSELDKQTLGELDNRNKDNSVESTPKNPIDNNFEIPK